MKRDKTWLLGFDNCAPLPVSLPEVMDPEELSVVLQSASCSP